MVTRAKRTSTVQVSEMHALCLPSPEIRTGLQAAGARPRALRRLLPVTREGLEGAGGEGGDIRCPRWGAHAPNTARSLLVLSTARSVEQ